MTSQPADSEVRAPIHHQPATPQQLLAWAQQHIKATDARILLRDLVTNNLNWPPSALITRVDDPLPATLIETFKDQVYARQQGQPIAYLVGHREFFGIELKVDAHTLIPRHETEHLVEVALQLAPYGCRLVDWGTGSGAIAIALKSHRPDLHITAIDNSAPALSRAIKNAQSCGVEIKFIQADWHHPPVLDSFHVIVSNPPYLAASDPHLQLGDCRFEPVDALTDGSADGLAAIRAILSWAQTQKSSLVLLEHGYTQGQQVHQLMLQLKMTPCHAWYDLAQHWRVSGARVAL